MTKYNGEYMRNYAILSDIHGNLQALEAVLADMEQFNISGSLLLGDLIDYGMQSNEVVSLIKERFPSGDNLICNLWGNHEREIIEETFSGFSSKRGEACARHTAEILTDETRSYLITSLEKRGRHVFDLDGHKCMAVHGSLEDPYWKAIMPGDVRGDYSAYDIVFSGHSHKPHSFYWYYPSEDERYRNRHAVLYINPGAVGQPRNHNPLAQYAILDTDSLSINMRAVEYDIESAMALYDGSVDEFYRERLKYGD